MMMGNDVRTVVYMYVLSYPQILTTLMKADRNNAVGHPFKTLALFSALSTPTYPMWTAFFLSYQLLLTQFLPLPPLTSFMDVPKADRNNGGQ